MEKNNMNQWQIKKIQAQNQKHFQLKAAISAQQNILTEISQKMGESAKKEKSLKSLQEYIDQLEEKIESKERDEKFEFEKLMNEISAEQMIHMASMNSLAPERIMFSYQNPSNQLLFPEPSQDELKRLVEFMKNKVNSMKDRGRIKQNTREAEGYKRMWLPRLPKRPTVNEEGENDRLKRFLMNPIVLSHNFKPKERLVLDYLFRKNAQINKFISNQVYSPPKMFQYPTKRNFMKETGQQSLQNLPYHHFF